MGIEVEVPSVARISPVADVRDPPGGHRFEVDDEIDASAIGAVHFATAEDHLTSSLGSTGLARREAKRGQDRIEDRGDLIQPSVAVAGRMASKRHGLHLRSV